MPLATYPRDTRTRSPRCPACKKGHGYYFKDHFRIIDRKKHHSAYAGYRETESPRSSVLCLTCGHVWRTYAKWVDRVPDLSDEERNRWKAGRLIKKETTNDNDKS